MPLPNSLPWMESVDAKIVRAHELFEVLDKEISEFVETARPHIERMVNQEYTETWLVFWVDDPFPPIRLSVLIGDCLHNLRSALDNLVCGLVRTRDQASSCAGRQFPIFTDPTNYLAHRKKMLRGVPKEARILIDGLQPCQRANGTKELDPLWILNALSNRDKHRAANLTLCYNRNIELLIPLKNGTSLLVKLGHDLVATQPETVQLPVYPSVIDDNVKVQIKGTGVIALRDDGALAERPIREVLITCLQYVEDRVIPSFKPFFSQ
jgi:hypothetical protein